MADKGPYSQSHGFSSSHIQIWELDQKEDWALKKWCISTVVLEETLESPLNYKKSNQVNPKGNQHWVFIEGLLLKLKLQYFGHLIERAKSLEKTLLLGKTKAKGEGGSREWDGWMASSILWIWFWANSGRVWKTEEPDVLQPMGLRRVRYNLATEQHLEGEEFHICPGRGILDHGKESRGRGVAFWGAGELLSVVWRPVLRKKSGLFAQLPLS